MDTQSSSTPMPAVSIGGVKIPIDDQGRYDLNAIHRASGLGAEKAPPKWTRNQQTDDLVRELEIETGQICLVSGEGRNGGTFAHELLAVSYAGWVSPSFQLKVNQAFLDAKSGRSRMPTTAEMFMQSAQLLVHIERRQDEQARALVGVDDRLKRVEDTSPLKVKPQNAETISEIRVRIAKRTGLPVRVINEVMASLPYSPKPAAMVKNSHEHAEGSSFAVYWIRDVTLLFDRFVGECKQVSPFNWKHPDIGKFKRVKPTE